MKKILVFLLAIVFLSSVFSVGEGVANSKKLKKRRFLPPVDNVMYAEECGTCHFLYLPGLLPAGSWVKVMEGAGDHFGEDLALDVELSDEILKYLKANSAETTGAKRARKILLSLHGETPLRITEVKYIKKKHHEIKAKVYKRESIGSFSNCSACHRTAAKGNFEEDNVKIPR